MSLYRQYAESRPENFENSRFFYKFSKGKAFRQVVGIHQFGKMPQNVAEFLKLNNPRQYTGHCFRRTSATILIDSGSDVTTLKRHGGWRSSSVAEGYVEDSIKNKIDVANRILKADNNENVNTASKVSSYAADFSSGKDSHYSQPMFNNCNNCTITLNVTNN